jgi:molybdopterin converting factor subunit 1
MTLKIILFASLAQDLGTGQITLEVAENATVGDVLAELSALHPQVAALGGHLAVAVNHRYADVGQRLSAHDEVALIPPISGG